MTIKHGESCDGTLHNHVAYDHRSGRYHAQMRCACRTVSMITPGGGHARFADAEAQSKAGGFEVIQLSPKRARRPSVKRVAKKRTTKPIITPDQATVDAAWVAYWKLVCARVGHESRL